MGVTFRCWLIANFEIVMYVFSLIITAILFFGIIDLDKAEAVAAIFKAYVGFAMFAGMMSLPSKKSTFQFGKYVFFVIIAIIVTISVRRELATVDETMRLMIKLLWIVFIIATVISAVIAVYTYKNIDEVLSRRMLYRNSNVGIFEYSWKYALDRFCNISLSIVISTFWISGVIILIREIKQFVV